MRDSADLCLTTAEALEPLRLARHDGSGNAVYCDAGEFPLGPVHALTASGAVAALALLLNKAGTIDCVASGAIDQFARVFTDDDGKITATNTGVCVGNALEAATADDDEIEVLPMLQRVPMVNAAVSATIGASSTAEADFDVTHSIPVQELVAGSIIRVKAMATILDADTTPQFDFKLYAGTEVIATITVAAAAASAADTVYLDAEIVVRVLGASGKLVAMVAGVCDAAGTAIAIANKAEATETTAAGLTIKCSGQFDASHASNTARLEILEVQHLR